MIGALRPQGQRLQHVLTRADAAIHMHLDLVAHRPHDARQHADRRQRAIQLPPAMVRHDDRIGAEIGGHRGRRRHRECLSGSTCRPIGRGSARPCPSRACGSNCSLVQLIRTDRSPTPLAWPTILRKVRRLVPSMPSAPARLGGKVQHVRQRQAWRGGQPVLQILVALAQDLQIQRQHQRRTFRRLRPLDDALRRNPRRS